MPNLLIIEDDAAFCQMLQKFLTKRGYEVETSFNAPDAKQKIQKSNFDLILTDLRLPDYDGIQLLSDIKSVNPATQVIVMTGYAEVGSAVNAMKKGAFDYISKPFTPDEIVMVLDNAMKVEAKIPAKVEDDEEIEDSDEGFCECGYNGNGTTIITDPEQFRYLEIIPTAKTLLKKTNKLIRDDPDFIFTYDPTINMDDVYFIRANLAFQFDDFSSEEFNDSTLVGEVFSRSFFEA